MKTNYFKDLLIMRLLLLSGLVFLLSGTVLAQNITVRGVVTSATTNETLPGVNVLQMGTTNGTSTGLDGSYSLNVPPGSTLVFSFIGMTMTFQKQLGMIFI